MESIMLFCCKPIYVKSLEIGKENIENSLGYRIVLSFLIAVMKQKHMMKQNYAKYT